MHTLFRGFLLVFLVLTLPVLSWSQTPPWAPQFVKSAYSDSASLEILVEPAGDVGSAERKLNAAGVLLLKSPNPVTRQLASDSIQQVLQRILVQDGVYAHNWNLQRQSVVEPADQSWKLFTWQHFVNDSTYQYHGILQKEDEPNHLYVLRDSAQSLGYEREYELRTDQWYGALYYNVHHFKRSKDRDAWLLFGFDANGLHERRKVVDVLTFSRSGEPLFGKEVFVGFDGNPTAVQSRLILQYRADANVNLNYDEQLEGILFDQLIPAPGLVKGAPPSLIPSGSYDGYVYDKESGTWKWRMEWFDRVISDEPPRPSPILGTSESRDLFGKPKKPRKQP